MNNIKWYLLDTLGADVDVEGVAARFTAKDMREILYTKRGWKRCLNADGRPASKLQLAELVWAFILPGDAKLRLPASWRWWPMTPEIARTTPALAELRAAIARLELRIAAWHAQSETGTPSARAIARLEVPSLRARGW